MRVGRGEWYENDGCGMDAEELEEATSFDASAIPILAPLVSAGLVEEDDTLGMLGGSGCCQAGVAEAQGEGEAQGEARLEGQGEVPCESGGQEARGQARGQAQGQAGGRPAAKPRRSPRRSPPRRASKKPSNPAGKKRGGAKAPTIGQTRREKGKREAQKMKRVAGASLVLLPWYPYVPLSGRARWKRPRYRKAPAPPSGRAAQDAVALAKRYYVKLVKDATKRRTKSGIVPFKLPFAMKSAAARRRAPGGDLWRAWGLRLDAAWLAQPAFGSGGLELPQSMRGPVRMEARAVCALAGADASIYVSVNGDFGCEFRFEIEMAVTPDNIQTLLAVQECVGFGSVRIRSRKEAASDVF